MSVVQGYASALQYGDQSTAAASNTWVPIAGILDIKPGKLDSKPIDVTVIDSPNQAEQFIAGWANGGECTIKCQFQKAQQATLFGLFRKSLGFRIVFNDAIMQGGLGSNLPFDGFIQSIQNEIDTKNLVTCELVIKISGLPTFNAAA